MSAAPIRNKLVLELHVPSFEPIREFYGIFGFEQLTYDPSPGGGSDLGDLVLVRRDSIGETMLNFYGDKERIAQHAHFKDFPADTPQGYGVEITIPVSDVVGLWKQVVEQLAKNTVSQPLTMKRWGKQDFRVVDPFGFYRRFTEPVDAWREQR